jgi:hypothetical protein
MKTQTHLFIYLILLCVIYFLFTNGCNKPATIITQVKHDTIQETLFKVDTFFSQRPIYRFVYRGVARDTSFIQTTIISKCTPDSIFSVISSFDTIREKIPPEKERVKAYATIIEQNGAFRPGINLTYKNAIIGAYYSGNREKPVLLMIGIRIKLGKSK